MVSHGLCEGFSNLNVTLWHNKCVVATSSQHTAVLSEECEKRPLFVLYCHLQVKMRYILKYGKAEKSVKSFIGSLIFDFNVICAHYRPVSDLKLFLTRIPYTYTIVLI